MRDGNVPRFFVRQSAAGKAQLVRRLAVQLSRTQLSNSQLFQLFMILLAREERLEERTGREEEGGGDGRRWKIIC